MKALILAAGQGTRLRPLTEDKPKVLVEVKGKALIEHIIEDLRSLDIDDITVIKGYMGEMLEQRLEKYNNITFVEQEEQLGTANAIGTSSFDSPFLAINGDAFIHRKNIKRVVSAFNESNADCVVGTYKVENPEKFGVLKVEGKLVKDILEKPDNPPSNLINTGTYAFSPQIYRYIEETGLSERGEYEITDSLQLMINDGKEVIHTKFNEYWIDVGRHEDLERAREVDEDDL